MNKMEIEPYIFISYAHHDAEIAKKITEKIKEKGFDVWIDYENIRGKEDFNDKIASAIYDSSIFISLVSSTYIEKIFCSEEIKYAHNHQKNCLAVYVEAVIPPPGHALDFIFSGVNQVNFNQGIDNEEDFTQLCNKMFDSISFEKLSEYVFGEKKEGPMPFIRPTIFDDIERYHKRVTLGNYHLFKLEEELYPPISIDSEIESAENNNLLLIEKLSEKTDTQFIIVGDGGSGKTVALKNIFNHFFSKFDPVIYVPLNKISDNLSLYLKEELDLTWDVFKRYGKCTGSNRPFRILFDGLNEFSGDRKKLLVEISDIMTWSNTQVVISSRNDVVYDLPGYIKSSSIKLEPLSVESVKRFLEKRGSDSKLSERMLSLLSNPLMLMLYVNTDFDYSESISHYSNYYKIYQTVEPETEGQVIWNFLQSQLYRLNEECAGSIICDSFFAIEYVLPLIAYYMISNNKQQISEYEVFDLLSEENMLDSDSYRYYYSRRVKKLAFKLGLSKKSFDELELLQIIFGKISLLVKTGTVEDCMYDFFHQCFRDFFAAMFIAKKIEMLTVPDAKAGTELTERAYSNEILKYVAQISAEEKAKPVFDDRGITFPGKNACLVPSEYSDSEKALSVFKGVFNEGAQNAVYNIMTIMSICRNRRLYNCDFSYLDLRKCQLKSCRFSEWYEDSVYPSSFEGAYIDTECFIRSGHQAQVSALCAAGERFFSADLDGNVKCWSMDSDKPGWCVDTGEGAVVCLACYENCLAILKQHDVFVYNTESEELRLITTSKNTYRHVRYNESGELEITFDTSPLTWQLLDNEETRCLTQDDMPCGCAIINSSRNKIFRSGMYGIVYVYEQKEARYELTNEIHMRDVLKGKKTTDLKYSCNEETFIVAFGSSVVEYDSETLSIRNILTLNSSVKTVCCLDSGKILVGSGVDIILLNKDFKIESKYVGESLPNILRVMYNKNILYTYDTAGSIKQFSDKMNVNRIRKPSMKFSSVSFGKDNMLDKKDKMFVITADKRFTQKNEPVCVGYDFERNRFFEPSKLYTIFNMFKDSENPDYEIHRLNNKLIIINKNTLKKEVFTSYKGITIFGCNFCNIQGTISEPSGRKLLKQNGGITDEC